MAKSWACLASCPIFFSTSAMVFASTPFWSSLPDEAIDDFTLSTMFSITTFTSCGTSLYAASAAA